MLTTPHDVVRAARRRLSSPESWCQGTPRDATGRAVNSNDPSATVWPIFAAHADEPMACMESDFTLLLLQALYRKRFAWSEYHLVGNGPMDLIHWNDDPARTHADILDLLDIALGPKAEWEQVPPLRNSQNVRCLV